MTSCARRKIRSDELPGGSRVSSDIPKVAVGRHTSRVSKVAIDGRVLVCVLVVGGLLTLQASAGLNAWKIGYLLLAVAALAGTVVSARWWLSTERVGIATPWLVSAAAFAAVLVCSFAVSRAHATPFASWLRDSAAYALFAAAPLFGLACARSASRRWMIVALVVFGALTAISFEVEWLARRNLLHLPIDRIVLPSGGLTSALFALATGFGLAALWKRWWWAVGAGVVLGLFFATGTRSALLLLAVPLGAGLLAGRPWRRTAAAVLTQVLVAAAVFLVADVAVIVAHPRVPIDYGSPQPTICPSSPVDSSGSGCMTVLDPTSNGLNSRLGDTAALFSDPGSDASLQERLTQTRVAWEAFLTSPLVGVGPGHSFHWTRSSKLEVDAYTLDTPLVYLAKFGVIGLVPLLLFAAAYLGLIFGLWRRRSEARTEFLAICGYGIVLVSGSLLGSPIEDKGISFGLALLVGLGCRALISGQPVSADAIGDQAGMRAALQRLLKPRG